MSKTFTVGVYGLGGRPISSVSAQSKTEAQAVFAGLVAECVALGFAMETESESWAGGWLDFPGAPRFNYRSVIIL